MIHSTASFHSLVPFRSSNKTSNPNFVFNSLNPLSSSTNSLKKSAKIQSKSSFQEQSNKNNHVSIESDSFSCLCGRRHFIGASGIVLLPTFDSIASNLQSDSKAMLNRVHPPRPDWYEEFYALTMENSMKPYESEIAGYKANLFTKLRGKSKVMELGIGTGPNLKYYAGDTGLCVFGVDPKKIMEKYAQAAATAAGLPLTQFNFTQAVGEALPVDDSSMDAVIGTLVLCSVKDVEMTLQEVKRVLKPGGLYIFIEHVAAKDGTALRFLQSVVDPLQQIVSDGCHLTRETGKYISQAGFSYTNINMVFLSTVSLIGPHVYGIASK